MHVELGMEDSQAIKAFLNWLQFRVAIGVIVIIRNLFHVGAAIHAPKQSDAILVLPELFLNNSLHFTLVPCSIALTNVLYVEDFKHHVDDNTSMVQ